MFLPPFLFFSGHSPLYASAGNLRPVLPLWVFAACPQILRSGCRFLGWIAHVPGNSIMLWAAKFCVFNDMRQPHVQQPEGRLPQVSGHWMRRCGQRMRRRSKQMMQNVGAARSAHASGRLLGKVQQSRVCASP